MPKTKVLISIDTEDLAILDASAATAGLTRSAYVCDVLARADVPSKLSKGQQAAIARMLRVFS